MVRVNLIGGNFEKWEANRVARYFMERINEIVNDYRDEFYHMRLLRDKSEDNVETSSEDGKRWYEVLPPDIKDDRRFRQKRDIIRLANSVFKDMEEKGLIPQGEGPFRKKEIRRVRRDFMKLFPKEDRRSGKDETDFMKKTREMMVVVISKNNPMELKRKLEEVEKRLDKVTVWGLEGLKI